MDGNAGSAESSQRSASKRGSLEESTALPPPLPDGEARQAATASRESTRPPPVPEVAQSVDASGEASTPLPNGSSTAGGEDIKQSLVDTTHRDTKLRTSADTGEEQTPEQKLKTRHNELRQLDAPTDKDYAPKQSRDRKTTMQRMQSFRTASDEMAATSHGQIAISDDATARRKPKRFDGMISRVSQGMQRMSISSAKRSSSSAKRSSVASVTSGRRKSPVDDEGLPEATDALFSFLSLRSDSQRDREKEEEEEENEVKQKAKQKAASTDVSVSLQSPEADAHAGDSADEAAKCAEPPTRDEGRVECGCCG